jgi:hypothetical protein
VFKLIFLPLRLAIGFLKVSGLKGLVLMGIGVGVGLLIAPQKGEQLRAQLQARLDEVRAGGPAGTAEVAGGQPVGAPAIVPEV